MTTTSQAQILLSEQASAQHNYFTQKVNIPTGYNLEAMQKVSVDGISAILFRYTKGVNNKINGEHFSFVVTQNKPYKILGFTSMDTKYIDKKQLSKKETEDIAKQFLKAIDPHLANELSNIWIDRHDEEITIGGEKKTVSGMKYKCYNKSQNNYAWVIVGHDGSIETFERDIIWSNGMQKRVTEKWLHDSWLAETGRFSEKRDEEAIKEMLTESFLNGALNKLNADKMREGFHPDFAILIANEDKLNKLPLDIWIDVVKKYKASPDKVASGERNVDYTFETIDITGKAAIVKIQLLRDGQLITTDYISLLKYADGWKAVSKISNEHIPNPFNI